MQTKYDHMSRDDLIGWGSEWREEALREKQELVKSDAEIEGLQRTIKYVLRRCSPEVREILLAALNTGTYPA
jgi:hypothetical protein